MKVKSTLVGNEQPTPQIDWDKPQLLMYALEPQKTYVVLTNGGHNNGLFSGVVVYTENNEVATGEIGDDFAKKCFSIVPPNQQIVLQNSND